MCSSGSAFPQWESLWVTDYGIQYGQHVLSELEINLNAKETRSFEFYFVPSNSLDEALMLRRLTDLVSEEG
jgi:hypothetical protein